MYLFQMYVCIWPMFYIKARGFFKHFLFLIEYKNLFDGVNQQYGKIFYTYTKEATEFNYKIFNFSGGNIMTSLISPRCSSLSLRTLSPINDEAVKNFNGRLEYSYP